MKVKKWGVPIVQNVINGLISYGLGITLLEHGVPFWGFMAALLLSSFILLGMEDYIFSFFKSKQHGQ